MCGTKESRCLIRAKTEEFNKFLWVYPDWEPFWSCKFQYVYHVRRAWGWVGEGMGGDGMVGRRIRADIGRFCWGTSILTHLSVSGYGSGRHKQPKLAHAHCRGVRVGAPLGKTRRWHPRRKWQQSNPAVQQAALMSNKLSNELRGSNVLISHLCPLAQQRLRPERDGWGCWSCEGHHWGRDGPRR